MCGIVAYTGGRSALAVLLDGLRRLEPPDYDSAGIALLVDGGLAAAKKAGTFGDVREELRVRPLPAATTGIGHIRRATLGPPTDVNAHPHMDGSGRVAVVQNGDITGHDRLRRELAARGHELVSETDTEAAAHLLAEHYSSCGDPAEAMRQVCRQLTGTFALVAVHADEPEVVTGGCAGLPLTVGVGDGETFLASHAAAFAPHTREAAGVGDGRVVTVRPEGAWVTDLDGVPVDPVPYDVRAAGAGEPVTQRGRDEDETVGGAG
ncbi:Glutamine amidotransferase domain-containing protein [Streptomyces sp. WMMB 322]|nr:Glutamine amidotransferase domain-containing protein [Streptomyces sp. WMMB 322]